MKRSDHKNGHHWKRWGIIGVVVLIVAILGGTKVYFDSALQPVNQKNTKTVEIYVPLGSSNDTIANKLAKQHLVKSALVFRYYAKTHASSGFKSGYYEFSQAMNVKTITTKLTKGGNATSSVATKGKLVVAEGETIDQIATAVQNKTKYSAKEFLALVQNQDYLNELAQKYPDLLSSAMSASNTRYQLEGYLFPATYDVKNLTSLKALVNQMVAAENTNLSPYYTTIKNKGFTVQQVLTLASLVEREGVTATDRKKIAGVFLNRIDQNMALQSDISVMYALNTHKKNLTYKDLKVDSPYNLYVNTGYGPGPFNSPSLQSIQSVLAPSQRSKGYLYFIADMKTGKVYYAKTYAEHQKLTAKLAADNK